MGHRILITGATGNLGRILTSLLLTRNADFVIGTSSATKAERLKAQGFATVEMDFARPETLVRAMRDMACVFLLVPLDERMAEWTANALEAAKETGACHLVRLSAFAADSHAECEYNRIQGHIDRAVQTSGLRYTLLRPNAFMQNFAVYYRDMIKSGTLYLTDGDGRTSWTDARDIAAVATEILLRPEDYEDKVYELTGPEALAGTDAARIISTVTGKTVGYQPIDENTARQGMRQAGMPEWNIEVLLSLSAFVREGKASAISTAVRDLIGREPISFERFARDYSQMWMGPE